MKEMTNWYSAAAEAAKRIHPEPDFDRGLAYPLDVLREHKREAFEDGARWQRSRLRSDEAVETVAISLLRSDLPSGDEDREDQWQHLADTYRHRARGVIIALLGQGP